MTTITINRATVEQALEAMRCAVPTGKITLYEWDKAMAALCAALAEDALDRLAENERALGIQMEAPRAALAQQAEPVEPVAEARYDGTLRWLEPHGVGLHRIQGPLYTAPPQRKPLTDQEIDRITDQQWAANSEKPVYAAHRAYARAVERALEEKNRGR